ncbi:hypothetical protein KAW11_02650 [Candidatus Bathyarchaeota archaeon]|nr:hypothetical protein [Candidatus Bathyarchaeota archaeon]
MTHITIEYMIMIPLLIMQILLFPLTASWLMNIWVNSRQNLALQDVSSHLGSTIQQLYFSLNHETISAGTAKYLPELPPFIENHHYTGNATLQTVLDPALNSTKVLDLTLTLGSTGIKVTTSVILGPNVLWRESAFVSNSTHACVGAEKFPNGTICLQFGE